MSAQITFASTVPRTEDGKLTTLQKILQQLINSGGGTVGSISLSSGASDPTDDPGVASALYYNTTTHILFQWDDSAGSWV